jgi:ferritin-like protein
MGSETYHEPLELLSEQTRNFHRAIVSLIEELEAIDWYQQRAEACSDADLKAVLQHHRREEIEHAMMNLEWLLRNDPAFAENARTYLFSQGPITEIESAATGGEAERGTIERRPPAHAQHLSAGAALGIGSLKPEQR